MRVIRRTAKQEMGHNGVERLQAMLIETIQALAAKGIDVAPLEAQLKVVVTKLEEDSTRVLVVVHTTAPQQPPMPPPEGAFWWRGNMAQRCRCPARIQWYVCLWALRRPDYKPGSKR